MFGVLVVSFVLIAINACFVLLEFSLVRVRASRIEMLARRGNSRAIRVQEVLGHLDVHLAAIQLGITIIGLALGWLGEPALAKWLGEWLASVPLALPPKIIHGMSFGVALFALAFVQIVFGELVPRFIGIQKAEIIALWGVPPLRLFLLIFRIPIAFMSFCAVSIVKMFGMKPAADTESIVSEEEMRILLGETQEKGTFPLERLLLLENLFDLGSAKVSEAMIPVDKVAFLSLKKTWEENLAMIRARRFSRYPLCEDGMESAIGMVHVKDLLLRAEGGPPDLRKLRRDISVVAEADSLEKLLKSFPDKGIHMALVGGSAKTPVGLLTLEDILEEIVGEVHDEFDLPQAWSLMDVVVASAVTVAPGGVDRQEAIAQLLAKLKEAFPDLNDAEVFKAVWDRELKFSSAVGRGVAVPHARLANLSRPMVVVGRFAKPIAFPSLDNVPVRLVFLVLTPAGAPIVQLKVLARIASLAINENLRRKLLRAKTSEAMLEILRTADTLLAA